MDRNPPDPGPGRLLVSELFYSIQGESTYAGYPCAFIRLAGCNLRCSYCDAGYTYEEPGRSMPLADLLGFSREYPRALVQITGGEPLLQEGVYPLMAGLLRENRTVLLETNGSKSLDRVPAGVIRIMDVKCPASGMSSRTKLDNLDLLTPADEIKFVLTGRADYDWAVKFIREHILARPGWAALSQRPTILLSPVSPPLDPAVLAGWMMEDQLPARLQLQLHRFLWPDKTRAF